jgi:hypothetical protein
MLLLAEGTLEIANKHFYCILPLNRLLIRSHLEKHAFLASGLSTAKKVDRLSCLLVVPLGAHWAVELKVSLHINIYT